MLEIKINTHGNPLPKINEKGDWIDLSASERVELKAGECKIIPLGVSMQLPVGYEAHLLPRSSTYAKWGIRMTNSMGIIDHSYSGDNDIWGFSAVADRDTVINKGDRIAQFRIIERQGPIRFVDVESLGNENRGGWGSTGTN